jgi:hypothetical protein
MEGIVIDTNVFVAAGFNPRSPLDKVEQIAKLISALQPHHLFHGAAVPAATTHVPAATSIYRLSGLR